MGVQTWMRNACVCEYMYWSKLLTGYINQNIQYHCDRSKSNIHYTKKIGHDTLVAMTGIILALCNVVKSLQLIWRLDTRRWKSWNELQRLALRIGHQESCAGHDVKLQFSFSINSQTFLPLSPPGWRGIVVTVRAVGRAGSCQTCGTHISVTAWWIFSVQSSVKLSRPVVVHRHGHLPICPIWACPWAKNLSNLAQIGSRLCGTHISETAGWIDPI